MSGGHFVGSARCIVESLLEKALERQHHESLWPLLAIKIVRSTEGRKLVAAVGGNLDLLETELNRLAHTGTKGEPTQLGADLVSFLVEQHSRMNRSSAETVTVGDLLIGVLAHADERTVSLVEHQGISQLDVLCYVSHRRLADNVEPATDTIADATGDGHASVVVVNDHYTPMEFVVQVLGEIIGVPSETAVKTMLEVHRSGRAIAARGPFAHAHVLALQVNQRARSEGYPLLVVLELT